MTALAFPHLWIPRPRIHVPTWADLYHATVGKIGRNSSGRIWRQSSGRVYRATGTDPCCCGLTCADCPGVPVGGSPRPSKITVVISGVTPVSCTCIKWRGGTFGPYYSWQMSSPLVINRAWTLEQNPVPDVTGDDNNIYYASYPGVNTGRVWRGLESDPDCTGTPLYENDEDYTTHLAYIPGVFSSHFLVWFSPEFFFGLPIFRCVMPGFCSGGVSSNLYTTENCGSPTTVGSANISLGYGGIATFSPC